MPGDCGELNHTSSLKPLKNISHDPHDLYNSLETASFHPGSQSLEFAMASPEMIDASAQNLNVDYVLTFNFANVGEANPEIPLAVLT